MEDNERGGRRTEGDDDEDVGPVLGILRRGLRLGAHGDDEEEVVGGITYAREQFACECGGGKGGWATSSPIFSFLFVL